ncbi:MAG: Fe-S metabolism protein SufE [Flavobacteriales bacterium]|nr:Fe-S metabolism protein SufE [Flavobacteriales bacterium]|tara:strand:+ start:84 stop:500 length:417 start_codon:yes stop_codon:yes gene_type:complete
MLEKIEKKIITDFSLFPSWEEKYEYIIELGKELAPLKQVYKSEKHLIKGCQSRVWLVCKYNKPKLYFFGDSDALITKGIVALVIKLYSQSSPQEIINNDMGVFSKIGLNEHLSMTRSNGLNSMLKVIKNYALKYYKNE